MKPQVLSLTPLAMIVSLAGLAVGCAKVGSDQIKTSAITSAYHVEAADPSTASCTAKLTVGSGLGATVVDLQSGDYLSCNGVTMNKTEDPITHDITYSGKAAAAAGAQVRILFHRSGENDYSSTVKMPDPIVLTAPLAASYPKKASIRVLYQPSQFKDAHVEANISGSDPTAAQMNEQDRNRYQSGLTGVDTDRAPEAGAVSLHDQIATSAHPYHPGNWTGTIILSRKITGVLAAGLSGQIDAGQTLQQKITLTDQ